MCDSLRSSKTMPACVEGCMQTNYKERMFVPRGNCMKAQFNTEVHGYSE